MTNSGISLRPIWITLLSAAVMALFSCAPPAISYSKDAATRAEQEPTLEQLEDEARLVAKYAPTIAALPDLLKSKHDPDRAGKRLRPQHAKMLAGFDQAVIEVPRDLPQDLQTGWLQPGRRYRATVRFSNASGIWKKSDSEEDLRGIAIRVHISPGQYQDFLLTNAIRHHARDAKQALASVAAPAHKGDLSNLAYLSGEIGLFEALRIAGQVKQQKRNPVPNLASETFYSRGCYAVGDVAIQFRLSPDLKKEKDKKTPSDLGIVLADTLKKGNVSCRLEIKRYKDPVTTPIEVGNNVWDVPFEPSPVFRLTLPKNAVSDPAIDSIRFSPFNLSHDQSIRPIGPLNRIRKPTYHEVHQQSKLMLQSPNGENIPTSPNYRP